MFVAELELEKDPIEKAVLFIKQTENRIFLQNEDW